MKKAVVLFTVFVFLAVAAIVWALSGTSDEYITGKWTFKHVPKFEEIMGSSDTGLMGIVSGALDFLSPGSNGTVIESNGSVHAYAAKNTFREATIHNYATAAASWTLSADEALCLYLAATNANAACTVTGPATNGKTFFFRNATGQAVQFQASGTTGVSITNAKSAWLRYSSTHADYLKLSSEF